MLDLSDMLVDRLLTVAEAQTARADVLEAESASVHRGGFVYAEGDELGCVDCGLKYGDSQWSDTVLSVEDWLLISPTGHQGGILCANCIVRRFSKLPHGPIIVRAKFEFAADVTESVKSAVTELCDESYRAGYDAGKQAQTARADALDAEVERCHKRLEIDHDYTATADDGWKAHRREIPRDQRHKKIDGIYCRDETIQLAKERAVELNARWEALKAWSEKELAVANQQVALTSLHKAAPHWLTRAAQLVSLKAEMSRLEGEKE